MYLYLYSIYIYIYGLIKRSPATQNCQVAGCPPFYPSRFFFKTKALGQVFADFYKAGGRDH